MAVENIAHEIHSWQMGVEIAALKDMNEIKLEGLTDNIKLNVH